MMQRGPLLTRLSPSPHRRHDLEDQVFPLALQDDLPRDQVQMVHEILAPGLERGLELLPVDADPPPLEVAHRS